MNAEMRQHRAREAARLLDEPLLKEALGFIEAQAMDELLTTKDWFGIGRRKRAALVDRINTVRELKSLLKAQILSGAKTEPLRVA